MSTQDAHLRYFRSGSRSSNLSRDGFASAGPVRNECARLLSAEDFVKLLTKVIVEPTVEQRIGTGRAHAHHVADGVRHHDLLGDPTEVQVGEQVEQVQWKPRDSED